MKQRNNKPAPYHYPKYMINVWFTAENGDNQKVPSETLRKDLLNLTTNGSKKRTTQKMRSIARIINNHYGEKTVGELEQDQLIKVLTFSKSALQGQGQKVWLKEIKNSKLKANLTKAMRTIRSGQRGDISMFLAACDKKTSLKNTHPKKPTKRTLGPIFGMVIRP